MCRQSCHTLPLSLKFIDYSSGIINLLLNILIRSITLCFYSLFVFWLTLVARQNTTRLIKIYYTPKHLIRYIFHNSLNNVCWKKYLKDNKPLAFIWHENMLLWILFTDIICSKKLVVFFELCSHKSVSFSEDFIKICMIWLIPCIIEIYILPTRPSYTNYCLALFSESGMKAHHTCTLSWGR